MKKVIQFTIAFFLLLFFFLALGRTSLLQRWMCDRIETSLTTQNVRVTVQGIEGTFPFSCTLKGLHIEVYDGLKQPQLSAKFDRVKLSLAFFSLACRQAIATEVALDHGSIVFCNDDAPGQFSSIIPNSPNEQNLSATFDPKSISLPPFLEEWNLSVSQFQMRNITLQLNSSPNQPSIQSSLPLLTLNGNGSCNWNCESKRGYVFVHIQATTRFEEKLDFSFKLRGGPTYCMGLLQLKEQNGGILHYPFPYLSSPVKATIDIQSDPASLIEMALHACSPLPLESKHGDTQPISLAHGSFHLQFSSNASTVDSEIPKVIPCIITANIQADSDYSIHLKNLEMELVPQQEACLQSNVTYNLLKKTLSADGTIYTSPFHYLFPHLITEPTEQVSFSLLTQMLAQEPSFSLQAFAPHLHIRSGTFDQVQLDATWKIHRNQWEGRVLSSMNLIQLDHIVIPQQDNCFPIHANFHWLYDKKNWTFSKVLLSLADTYFTSEQLVLSENTLFQGDIQLEATDLSPWGILTHTILEGQCIAQVNLNTSTIERAKTIQNASINLSLTDVKYRDTDIRSVLATCQIADIFNEFNAQLNIDCSDLCTSVWQRSGFHFESQFNNPFKASPSDPLWPFTLYLSNTDYTEKHFLSCSGSWSMNIGDISPHIAIQFDQLEGLANTISMKLIKPFLFKKTSYQLQLTEVLLQTSNRGQLQAHLDVDSIQADGFMQIKEFPLSSFRSIFGEKVPYGNLSAYATLKGTESSPDISLNLQGKNLSWSTLTDISCISCKTDLKLLNNQCHIKTAIEGLSTVPGIIEIHFPIQCYLLNATLEFPKDQPIAGQLSLEGNLESILAHQNHEDISLKGSLSAQFSLSGTLDIPHITGNLICSEGQLDLLGSGCSLRDINIVAHAQDHEILIHTLQGRDTRRGRFKGSGKIFASFEKAFPYHFELDLYNMAIINLDKGYAKVKGDLLFKGNLKQAELIGDLAIVRSQLNLSSDLNSEIPVIDIVNINIDSYQGNAPSKKDPIYPVNLDLAFSVPKKGKIYGRGLDSEWAGKIAIKGPILEPKFYGDLKIVQGNFVFSGREFDITQGQITVQGDLLKQSRLQVSAELALDEARIQANVRGSLDNPRLIFQSSPPLSQKEILSLILFNKTLAEISPMEGLQLAQAAMTLSGTSSGFDLMDRLKKSFGLDKFDISSSSDGTSNEVSLHVGKYLSKGILVYLSKDVSSEVNRIALEASIFKNIKVQAEVGDDAEGLITLKWKKDY